MFSNLTRNKCRLCSQLSLNLKTLISGFFDKKINCQQINDNIDGKDKERVAKINSAAPDCCCEKFRMSRYSPNVVKDDEVLARFVFSPIHVNKKNGKIKPSIFSHVFTVGCSIQRDSIATPEELVHFSKNFLEGSEERSWEGVLLASCKSLRDVKINSGKNRAFCIYDTANSHNPAHGEVSQSQYVIEEADGIELRHDLFTVFNNGEPVLPHNYRNGSIWGHLPNDLQRPSVIAKLSSKI